MNEPDWTKDTLTNGETLGPAMEIETEDEARQYLDNYVDWMVVKHGMSRVEALNVAKQNIGYYSGYYGVDTQRRVERVFKCVHPIFGSTSGEQMSVQEILEQGRKMGEESKKGKGLKMPHGQPTGVPTRMSRGDFVEFD
tara:strand:+ start:104394 stop:104810 length:417 start_codon:yes stop_codon:yes gene_type:complete